MVETYQFDEKRPYPFFISSRKNHIYNPKITVAIIFQNISTRGLNHNSIMPIPQKDKKINTDLMIIVSLIKISYPN